MKTLNVGPLTIAWFDGRSGLSLKTFHEDFGRGHSHRGLTIEIYVGQLEIVVVKGCK